MIIQLKFSTKDFFKSKSSVMSFLKFVSTRLLKATSSFLGNFTNGSVETLCLSGRLVSISFSAIFLIIGRFSITEHFLQICFIPDGEITSNKIALSSEIPHLKHCSIKFYRNRIFNFLYCKNVISDNSQSRKLSSAHKSHLFHLLK